MRAVAWDEPSVVASSGLTRPARRRWGLAAARSVVIVALSVCGANTVAAEASPLAASAGMALLQKMQEAARTLDYAGVYTYQQGSTVLSTRIVHIVDGTGERERISVLDGRPREYIRHNETTQCLLPDHEVILVERREPDRFPAILFDDGARLPAHYELRIGETSERVAGRDCDDLTLVPRDAHRYGFRLCADQATGLLLRAQTVGPEGVLTQVVFNTLETGKGVQSESLTPAWNTKHWQVVEVPVAEVDLAAEGWRIPLPPGYQAVTQVQRPMRADRQVKQLVASDGLSAISIFIEAYAETAGQARDPGMVRNGGMSVYRKRMGDHWLTVLGEVPGDTVRDLADRTEYVPMAAR